MAFDIEDEARPGSTATAMNEGLADVRGRPTTAKNAGEATETSGTGIATVTVTAKVQYAFFCKLYIDIRIPGLVDGTVLLYRCAPQT